MPQSIELTVGGEPIELRVYPHPDRRSISLSINSARGCIWRTLVDVATGAEHPDDGRAHVHAALAKELRDMRLVYAVPAFLIGAVVGIGIAMLKCQ